MIGSSHTGSVAQLGAILLAAGSSRRLGRPKQFVEIEGQPLVVRQAKCLLSLKPACVVVVTGDEKEQVIDSLGDLPVTVIVNPHWSRGMGSSLALGIGAMPERVRAAMVLLCDQWRVDEADLQELIDAWSRDPLCAVVSNYGDATGPPAILPRALFDQLARLRGDTGAKRILRRWKGSIRKLPLARAESDIDTAGDVPP